jgi:hypothetical protein
MDKAVQDHTQTNSSFTFKDRETYPEEKGAERRELTKRSRGALQTRPSASCWFKRTHEAFMTYK